MLDMIETLKAEKKFLLNCISDLRKDPAARYAIDHPKTSRRHQVPGKFRGKVKGVVRTAEEARAYGLKARAKELGFQNRIIALDKQIRGIENQIKSNFKADVKVLEQSGEATKKLTAKKVRAFLGQYPMPGALRFTLFRTLENGQRQRKRSRFARMAKLLGVEEPVQQLAHA